MKFSHAFLIPELTNLSKPLFFFFKVHHMDNHQELFRFFMPAFYVLCGDALFQQKKCALKLNIAQIGTEFEKSCQQHLNNF